jgi:hypothetical protein
MKLWLEFALGICFDGQKAYGFAGIAAKRVTDARDALPCTSSGRMFRRYNSLTSLSDQNNEGSESDEQLSRNRVLSRTADSNERVSSRLKLRASPDGLCLYTLDNTFHNSFLS